MAEKKTDTNDLFFTFGGLRDKVLKRTEENRKQEDINSTLQNIQKSIEDNMTIMSNRIKNMNLNEDTPPFMQNLIKEQIQKGEEVTVEKKPLENIIQEEKNKTSALTEPTETKPVKLLDKAKIRVLRENLSTNVFGQDPVIEEVVDVLKIAALNIKINKDKPAGNYLFAGPSGVGKTELAQSLATSLGVPILVVNMGEYGLEQDVTKLIGTSPGYVGYNEGGVLTNFVIENPVCIVLFDELEKAHSSADKILLSIMDKGIATDNKGKKVIFKETIMISTSNLGADIEYIQGLEQEEKNKYRMEAIKEGLRPEIINRYDSVFHFYSLSKEIYSKVVQKFLNKLIQSMAEEHKINLKFSDKMLSFIVESSFDPSMGGRPARRFIEKVVIKPLADYMLDENFEKAIGEHPNIILDINKDKNVCFKGKNKKILGILNNTKELVDRFEEGKFTDKTKS
jgi:ATP-dependent Clp protease ATP-binding subunit ClpA